LLRRVIAGEEIAIVKAGRPVAKLVPYVRTEAERVPGRHAGQIRIAPDFDAPLTDEIVDLLEGFGSEAAS
jgi:antitoxin (DNA-binding transcriptional repressor) of toxin-antitoxin stability system